MNLINTNNTLHFSGTNPAVAALLFALALGVSTLASAAPKGGPDAQNQPVQSTPDVCTIQVDLADVVDTNAPDGGAPLSLIVSTQTQLWAQDVSASSPNNQASSQSQSSKKSVEADASGFLRPDAVDTAVAGYILEEGTAEVVQVCSMIATNRGRRNASELYCEDLVLSCDMAGEAVASDVSLCLDAGSVSQDACASEHTAVVRLTYTFTNTDLVVETPLDALSGPTTSEDIGGVCPRCHDICASRGLGSAMDIDLKPVSWSETCNLSGGLIGRMQCTQYVYEFDCDMSVDVLGFQVDASVKDCGECIDTSGAGSDEADDEADGDADLLG